MRKMLFLFLVMAAGVARGQVAGIYQLAGNPNMFIRFVDRDKELVARFLWETDTEIHFLPDSGLVFDRKDEGERGPVHIQFRKDAKGRVAHVTMGNGTEWDRVNGTVLTAGQLKALAGSYRSIDDSDNHIVLTPGDNVLVVREEWSGRQAVLAPLSDTFFFSAQPEYTLQILPSGESGSPKTLKVMGRYTFLLTGK